MRRHLGGLELVKWLALAAMLVDHVDMILLHRSQPWMYEVGRFALPAFAVCFGIGLARSRDPMAVGLRLIAPAMLAQVAWFYAGRPDPVNILVTFFGCAMTLGIALVNRPIGIGTAVALVALSTDLEGGVLTMLMVFAGWLSQRVGSQWPHAIAAAPWLFFFVSPGAVAGLLAPHVAARLEVALPRVPGLLAWAYPAHIAGLAAIAAAAQVLAH